MPRTGSHAVIKAIRAPTAEAMGHPPGFAGSESGAAAAALQNGFDVSRQAACGIQADGGG
jgi:hypothetical protein